MRDRKKINDNIKTENALKLSMNYNNILQIFHVNHWQVEKNLDFNCNLNEYKFVLVRSS